MIIVFMRTLIIYITLIITMRLLGKRQIGEMQPFEFIITLIIADLACIPMGDLQIPLLYGIVAIMTIFLLHQIFYMIEKSGRLMKRTISGKPSVVINKDGVQLNELKRDNLDVGDLLESMRALGYFSFDDLDYAIFESNGKLSALENSKRKEKSHTLPILVVENGKIINDNLNILKFTKQELLNIAEVKKEKFIEVLTIDEVGKSYIKLKNKKYFTKTVDLKKGVSW